MGRVADRCAHRGGSVRGRAWGCGCVWRALRVAVSGGRWARPCLAGCERGRVWRAVSVAVCGGRLAWPCAHSDGDPRRDEDAAQVRRQRRDERARVEVRRRVRHAHRLHIAPTLEGAREELEHLSAAVRDSLRADQQRPARRSQGRARRAARSADSARRPGVSPVRASSGLRRGSWDGLVIRRGARRGVYGGGGVSHFVGRLDVKRRLVLGDGGLDGLRRRLGLVRYLRPVAAVLARHPRCAVRPLGHGDAARRAEHGADDRDLGVGLHHHRAQRAEVDPEPGVEHAVVRRAQIDRRGRSARLARDPDEPGPDAKADECHAREDGQDYVEGGRRLLEEAAGDDKER
eukprot:2209526-Prymnesium_polylepis.2